MVLGNAVLEEVNGFRSVKFFSTRLRQMSNILEDLEYFRSHAMFRVLEANDGVVTLENDLKIGRGELAEKDAKTESDMLSITS
jgi:hypothetical protein